MILKSNKQKFQKKKISWTNKSQKPAESSYTHKWTMPHTVLFWCNRGSLCCFFLCSGRILTTAHIPWERYTMLLLLLPSCSSLYIPRLFYSNRPVIVHIGVTFFRKKHHLWMSPSLLGRRARLMLLVTTLMILHSYASLPFLSTINDQLSTCFSQYFQVNIHVAKCIYEW